DQFAQSVEVLRIRRVERELVRRGDRGDHLVGDPAAWSPSHGQYGGHDLAVGPRGLDIEGQRVEDRFGVLENADPTGTLDRIGRVMWTGRQLGERYGGDRELAGQHLRPDPSQVNH